MARATKAWLEEHSIMTINWPPYSPDLNPIKHVWKYIKIELIKNNPEMYLIKDNEADWQRFCYVIQEAWNKVSQQ